MYIFHLIVFFAAAIAAADYFKTTLPKVIPVLFCTLGIILYGLAFFRHLTSIDIIAGIILLITIVYFFKRIRSGNNPFLLLKDSYFWGFLALSVVIFLSVQYRQVLEWDAYNFWAADVKSLFYINGFADKYCNVAATFGDYPPAMQLILWWFTHLFCNQWNEGILFSGYLILGASFLFRLASTISINSRLPKIITALSLGILAILLPGVVDTSWYRSLYADPIMALVFGTILCIIIENKTKPSSFSQISILILLIFLTLTKSIGFLWAIFAVLFFFLWNNKNKRNCLFALSALLIVGIAYSSWAIFCNIMERTTYLTESISGTAEAQIQTLLNGTFLNNPINIGLCKSFFSAFFTEPMHRQWSIFIDLTPFLFWIILGITIFILFKKNIVTKNEFIKIMGYTCFVGIFTYAMLLTAHLTIFIYETAYLESTKMIEQMTRYSSPATIGFLMMIICCITTHQNSNEKNNNAKGILMALAVLILCSTCYSNVLDCFIKGHDPLNPQRIESRNTILQNYDDYIKETKELFIKDPSSRVLFCVTYEEEFDYKCCVVSYNVSPVSMMYFNQPSENSYTDIIKAFQNSHAEYLYISSCSNSTLEEFRKITPDFQTKTMYKATYQNGTLFLEKI